MKQLLTFPRALISRYFDHGCGRTGAALAYYLLFSLFPLLFFLSQLIGLLNIPPIDLSSTLGRVIPSGAIELFNSYLSHVTDRGSHGLLAVGLVSTFYFPMRAMAFLMQVVGKAYSVEPHRSILREYLVSFLLTLLLGLVIVLSLLFILFGRSALTYLSGVLPISPEFISIWNWLRFLALGALLFAVLCVLYGVSVGRRVPVRFLFPGAGASILAWVLISAGFSFYVDNLADYSVVYGSLGTVIVLMVWLFLGSVTIVMGAELNGALLERSGHSLPKK